ncbi:type II 3-dehydroquinate dehydratase [Domibacillus sp. DTU_2020_1001157_1_SI_ALB_TIR_016]|uniref:type II 3-dehydroquinate dehydratase n=1 Tax=Domibacillus sp. DTU_2020_1001157_1_SI_ALB_TIR_016 TaxID=3077789 RepID=UPI0028E6F25F|nr:type II 3-dehydroquinate dehydratase [Domibacillus sp. DTU_2020_1001157_1_SI_ALB_TIR_016]WNS81981.1 type II 3-dehydroquinate dehydratase [Domibacillus sp. DTU_2020_1001157_1_SI_ALB_TIR_016]
MKKILLINGVNLNRLGKREPHIYGTTTLAELEERLIKRGAQAGVEVVTFHSNFEGEIVERLHLAEDEGMDGIIFNPGAFTHYSYAIADAAAGINVPIVEVHISNIHKREAFRHHSVTASHAVGQLCGFGLYGYEMALDFLVNREG